MTYLDYREQALDFQGERTSVFPLGDLALRSSSVEKSVTLYYSKQSSDLVQYFQRIIKLLKIEVNYELLEGSRGEQEDLHAMNFFKRKLQNDEKIILFEDLSVKPAFTSSPLYQNLLERSIDPKNVAIFSREFLALDQKSFNYKGEFGFVMKKFFFYNFPQDWMVVYAHNESFSLRDWILY